MFKFFQKVPPPPTVPPDPSRLALQSNECQTFTLPDSRKLGYATYGSTTLSDPVIFLFHGMPGSRICGRSWDKLCQRLNARLISVDQPGCGLSTMADRRFTDWPDDVLSLADHLGARRFSVVGASGGGPYALACARFIPKERLRRTTVVCGIAPLDALMDTTPWLSWRLMGLTKWFIRLVARWVVLPSMISPYLTKDASRLKRVIEDSCKTPEEKALIHDTSDENNLDNAVVQFLEAFKQGTCGAIHDGKLLMADWGFDLQNVDSERVWLVHGDRDVVAPVECAEWMDRRLGGGTLTVLERKTHFTIWKDHSEEIFRKSVTALRETSSA